jgi:DNA repair protein SbcC/Rad50
MSLSISQLQDRLVTRYPDFELVDDYTIRFIKKSRDKPYAVYYFDVREELPNTKEALSKYQDEIIGKYYFEGNKSLQWSNYLYFITTNERISSGDISNAKELIERDRSYARKFVIPEDDLDFVLSPKIISPDEGTPHTGILSIWAEALDNTGFDKAIFSDDNMPTRLKYIEDSSSIRDAKSKKQIQVKKIDDQSFIQSLTLNRFRNFPVQHEFSFGNVNLIFGRNGSGKTSLLEAIEYFYCGRNKRNIKTIPNYSVTATFENGTTDTARSNRDLQLFRDRNLVWYGQPEVRTNNLSQSFSQFNFLDTDAAVELAQSTSPI